jgi:hypothetical protein
VKSMWERLVLSTAVLGPRRSGLFKLWRALLDSGAPDEGLKTIWVVRLARDSGCRARAERRFERKLQSI